MQEPFFSASVRGKNQLPLFMTTSAVFAVSASAPANTSADDVRKLFTFCGTVAHVAEEGALAAPGCERERRMLTFRC